MPMRVNTQYDCYSTIVLTFKMESVSKITIFGLKKWSKKNIFKSLHAGNSYYVRKWKLISKLIKNACCHAN